MKRIIFFTLICGLLVTGLVLADSSFDEKVDKLTSTTFESVKLSQEEICVELDLSLTQKEEKKLLDIVYYPRLQNAFKEMGESMRLMNSLISSGKYTKEQVEEARNKYLSKEEEAFNLKEEYEQKLIATFDRSQKNKYKSLKNQRKKELKKQIKEAMKAQKQNV